MRPPAPGGGGRAGDGAGRPDRELPAPHAHGDDGAAVSDRERALLEGLAADTAALAAIVTSRWRVAADPLGSAMLLPVGLDDDPLPVDELPWPAVVDDFRAMHGRPPRPGARALAQRRLVEPRHPRGGPHG